MKRLRYIEISLGIILTCLLISCEDFLEVDTPDHKISSETLFSSDETAISAMTGIYNELFRTAFSGGWEESVMLLAGLSADEIQCIRNTDLPHLEFELNKISPSNNRNLAIWSSSYNIIYMVNSLIEGIDISAQVSETVHTSLEGEAKFVRAFTYFYLVNLYSDVPLLLTTDYRENALASRADEASVYEQIVLDLKDAIGLLSEEYRDGDRTRVNRFAAIGMLARVNLYLENWEEAERLSALVLNQPNVYALKEDLDEVFLANSMEALWQISPIGNGGMLVNTREGSMFLFPPSSHALNKFSLTNELVEFFDPNDKRFKNWIGYHEPSDSYFAHKYKIRSSTDEITEYSMALRFTEQYLIRAEARAHQNNLSGAIEDIDVIRLRAGVDSLIQTNPSITQDQLLDLIMEERRNELFTEWGHRWLDLKRMGKTVDVLGPVNLLLPIPEEERIKNPNLDQNLNY